MLNYDIELLTGESGDLTSSPVCSHPLCDDAQPYLLKCEECGSRYCLAHLIEIDGYFLCADCKADSVEADAWSDEQQLRDYREIEAQS